LLLFLKKEQKQMLELFEPFEEGRLRRLPGGRVQIFHYFISINNDEEVFYGRLLNNFQSQKQPCSHPAGYLPFLIGDESSDFDLQTHMLSVRKLTLYKGFQGTLSLYRSPSRVPAVILKTPAPNSAALLTARRLWERTWLREQVRRACKTLETLTIVTDLLEETWLHAQPKVPAQLNLVARFEYYLRQTSDQTLRDLVAVVQEPQ
jgi:hypothetical protein